MATFASRVKDLLEEKKKTATWLGKMTGLDEGSISRLLNGQRKHPRADTVQAIAAALGVTTQFLLTGGERAETPSPPVRQTTVVYDDSYPSRAVVMALLKTKVDANILAALASIRLESDRDPGEAFWISEIHRLKRQLEDFERGVTPGPELQPEPGDRMPP